MLAKLLARVFARRAPPVPREIMELQAWQAELLARLIELEQQRGTQDQ